jgi:hypothetical protein
MPLSDRDTLLRVLDEVERAVREMAQGIYDLRHPERWDDYDARCENPLEYVRRRLETLDDTPYVLAHLRDLKYAIGLLPPPPEGERDPAESGG